MQINEVQNKQKKLEICNTTKYLYTPTGYQLAYEMCTFHLCFFRVYTNRQCGILLAEYYNFGRNMIQFDKDPRRQIYRSFGMQQYMETDCKALKRHRISTGKIVQHTNIYCKGKLGLRQDSRVQLIPLGWSDSRTELCSLPDRIYFVHYWSSSAH